MRFFGKKKRKQSGQPQPTQMPALRAVENRTVEARADANTQIQDSALRERSQPQIRDTGYRERSPKQGRAKRTPSRSPTSRGEKKVLSQKQLPAVRPKANTPPSILHKNTHYGTTDDLLSPPPLPASFCHGRVPGDPRVRFASSGGDQSVDSRSQASVPHLMVGANSVASSSAMSSHAMLNRVMDEEYRRLSAMGMGFGER